MSAVERIFYPSLVRQGTYPRRPDGKFYVYSYYREYVAMDCQHRCVYCDAFADDVGGAEAMQLDHFRPESFEEFAALIDDPSNLHYACARCNLLKSNHWPARGTDETHGEDDGFIDPFAADRLHYFEIKRNGRIEPLRAPAPYMIRLLRLDREFLRTLREHRQLRAMWRDKAAAIRVQMSQGKMPDAEELDRVLESVEKLLA